MNWCVCFRPYQIQFYEINFAYSSEVCSTELIRIRPPEHQTKMMCLLKLFVIDLSHLLEQSLITVDLWSVLIKMHQAKLIDIAEIESA